MTVRHTTHLAILLGAAIGLGCAAEDADETCSATAVASGATIASDSATAGEEGCTTTAYVTGVSADSVIVNPRPGTMLYAFDSVVVNPRP